MPMAGDFSTWSALPNPRIVGKIQLNAWIFLECHIYISSYHLPFLMSNAFTGPSDAQRIPISPLNRKTQGHGKPKCPATHPTTGFQRITSEIWLSLPSSAPQMTKFYSLTLERTQLPYGLNTKPTPFGRAARARGNEGSQPWP